MEKSCQNDQTPHLRVKQPCNVSWKLQYYYTLSQFRYSLIKQYTKIMERDWQGDVAQNRLLSQHLIVIGYLILGHRNCKKVPDIADIPTETQSILLYFIFYCLESHSTQSSVDKQFFYWQLPTDQHLQPRVMSHVGSAPNVILDKALPPKNTLGSLNDNIKLNGK